MLGCHQHRLSPTFDISLLLLFQTAQSLKQNQDDQVAILQLKSELSKAWTMFDSANEKEQRLRETVQTYKGSFL